MFSLACSRNSDSRNEKMTVTKQTRAKKGVLSLTPLRFFPRPLRISSFPSISEPRTGYILREIRPTKPPPAGTEGDHRPGSMLRAQWFFQVSKFYSIPHFYAVRHPSHVKVSNNSQSHIIANAGSPTTEALFGKCTRAPPPWRRNKGQTRESGGNRVYSKVSAFLLLFNEPEC